MIILSLQMFVERNRGKMKTYTIKKGTKISENENEIMLKRGAIHKNELIIDKKISSREFVEKFHTLSQQNTINVGRDDMLYDDFETLTKFGFLTNGINQNAQLLLVVDDQILEEVEKYFDENNKVIAASRFLTEKDVEALTEDKDVLKIADIVDEKKNVYQEFGHIYLLSRITEMSYLRGFNKLMKLVEQENTIAFFDNENVFVASIKHGETGCYECLEQQLMSHFDGFFRDYINGCKY